MPRFVRLLLTTVTTVIVAAATAALPTVLAAANEPPPPAPIVDLVQDVFAQRNVPAVGVPTDDDSARVAAHADRYRQRVAASCDNALVLTLREAGFRGENVKEAWAIAMRESNGQPHLGPGHPQFNGSDYGLFQFNMPSWGDKEWFDPHLLLDGLYNAKVAFELSDGGRDWLHWGHNGDGTPNFKFYSSIWSQQQMYNWIVEPFERYSGQFDLLPQECRDN